MLNVLRDSFKSRPYLRWVLALVGLSMVFYLGSYFVGDGGTAESTNWVARVNGSQVPDRRYRERAKELDTDYRERLGSVYEQLKPQLQIARRALEDVIDREVVLQDAARIGLTASAADVARQIRNHPELQVDGRFIGKERYMQVLQSYPGGYAAFERMLAETIVQAQWAALVTRPVTVGDDELARIFRQRTEKTAIDYVLFTSADQKVDREVGESELQAWYDGHLADYQRPAGRKIRYVVVDRDSRLEAIPVSADEIRVHYEANRATYAHPDQRRARHILFEVDPGASADEREVVRREAEAALGRLRAGADFGQLAGELSDDAISAARGGDLDFFGRGTMLPSFEDAAFSTPVGQFAPMTETPHGYHVIEVTDDRPAGVQPLEDVEDDIRRLLRLRKVDTQVLEEAERLRQAMGGAERFAEVAEREGLAVTPLFFNERERPGTLGPSPEFRSAVAAQEPGTLSAPLRVAAGLALVVVDEVVPAAPAPLADVRAEVERAVLDARARDAALATASAALERQPDLTRLARSLGRDATATAELGPGQPLAEAGGASAELEQALFGAGADVGRRGVVSLPRGAVAFQITRREPIDEARFLSEKARLRDETLFERRGRHLQVFLERLRARQRVEINRAWLESAEGAG